MRIIMAKHFCQEMYLHQEGKHFFYYFISMREGFRSFALKYDKYLYHGSPHSHKTIGETTYISVFIFLLSSCVCD